MRHGASHFFPCGEERVRLVLGLACLIRDKWYLIAEGQARWITFSLNAALTKTTASVASCTVNSYHNCGDPGSTVTIWNPEGNVTTYIFEGDQNDEGIALYSVNDDKYWCVQLECD